MKALSHMQYDLFCKTNYVVRSLLSIGCVIFGVYHLESWWAYLLIAYGAFLFTGKYNQSNHTVKKIIQGINDSGIDFPSSEFVFTEDTFKVYALPECEETEAIPYPQIERIGMDASNFYIFRNKSGGYVIPRSNFSENEKEFKEFLKEKSGQIIFTKHTPPVRKMIYNIKKIRRK